MSFFDRGSVCIRLMVFIASGFTCCLYLSGVFGSGGDAVLFCELFNSVLVRNGKAEGFCLVSFHLDMAHVGAAAVNDLFLAGVDHLDTATTVASGCERRGPRYKF